MKQSSVVLKNGEHLEWQSGNFVCIEKDNKYKLGFVNQKRGILYNRENSWLFKKKFDYISEPEKLISIFRINGTSRLINIPSGSFITSENLYVENKVSENEYLARDLKKGGSILINISNIKR